MSSRNNSRCTDVSGIVLAMQKGANIIGDLKDAVTGSPVTGEDGVLCTAKPVPWVERQWRETRSNDPMPALTSKVRKVIIPAVST